MRHFTIGYVRKQLEKKLEREGVEANIYVQGDELLVRLLHKEDFKKVPDKYYRYRVRIDIIKMVGLSEILI